MGLTLINSRLRSKNRKLQSCIIFALALLIATIAWPNALGVWQDQDQTARSNRLRDRINAIVLAENESATAKEYKALFEGLDYADLDYLKMHSHDGIALRAAWQEVRLDMGGNPRPWRRVDERLVNRFLGFLDGRLRVSPPWWWSESVALARAIDASQLTFPSSLERVPYKEASCGRFKVPRSADVTCERGQMVVSMKAKSITLSDQLAKKCKGVSEPSISPRFGAGECVIALHSSFTCAPYSLYCIDTQSNTTIWEAQVLGRGKGLAGGIGGHHWVDVNLKNEKVIVFGVGSDVAYLEILSLKDGKCTLRFRTCY